MATSISYTVTPWRSRTELLNIRTALYHPPSPSALTSALSLIRAWRLRGSLPHAIDSTAQLLEAQLFHAKLAALPSFSANEASLPLRATYTAALGRFVTGFADIGRHKSGPARSMLEVARDIALPPRFVEMRHEAAHEDLPSLPRLVGLAEEALAWLWGAYWVRLDGEGKAGQDGEEDWRAVLRGFRKARVKLLQSGGLVEAETLLETTAAEVVALAEGSKGGYARLAEALCTQGMLIPVAGTMAELEKRIGGAFDIWEQLLFNLAQRSRKFMKPFLSVLARSASGNGSLTVEHRGLTMWLARIAQSEGWDQTLGLRKAPLLSHTLKACLIDTSGQPDSSEAVCRLLLAELDQSDLSMWVGMFSARFGTSADGADQMEVA